MSAERCTSRCRPSGLPPTTRSARCATPGSRTPTTASRCGVTGPRQRRRWTSRCPPAGRGRRSTGARIDAAHAALLEMFHGAPSSSLIAARGFSPRVRPRARQFGARCSTTSGSRAWCTSPSTARAASCARSGGSRPTADGASARVWSQRGCGCCARAARGDVDLSVEAANECGAGALPALRFRSSIANAGIRAHPALSGIGFVTERAAGVTEQSRPHRSAGRAFPTRACRDVIGPRLGYDERAVRCPRPLLVLTVIGTTLALAGRAGRRARARRSRARPAPSQAGRARAAAKEPPPLPPPQGKFVVFTFAGEGGHRRAAAGGELAAREGAEGDHQPAPGRQRRAVPRDGGDA